MMTNFRALPPHSIVRSTFDYDKETGLLLRNGKPTGHYRTRRGESPWMVLCSVAGVQYAAHRLIWLWMTGSDPAPLTIDHIDRNPFNNRWANLRLADVCLQAQNRQWKATIGHKGVSFHKSSGKWSARKSVNGQRIYLGIFSDKEDAIRAIAES